LENTDVPFIITQVFSIFWNLEHYVAVSSGLRRIQSHAIQNAPKLSNFLAHMNSNLTLIHAFAFSGGFRLESVNVQNSPITDIHPNAFVGLTNVRSFGLQNNGLTKFPKNMLQSLPRLQTVFFRGNNFEVLDTSFFPFNRRMIQIGFVNNRINAIDRNLFKAIPFMNFLFLQGNSCIDFNIIVEGQTAELIQQNLRPCFENFERMRQDFEEV
jgi:hypothetical protein